MDVISKPEWLSEALTFSHGDMVLVSGPDLSAIEDVLEETVDHIESNTSNSAILFDGRSTVLYPERKYHFIVNQDNPPGGVVHARLWEFVKVSSVGSFVSLVANEFDRSKLRRSFGLAEDVVMDLHEVPNPIDVPQGGSRSYSSPGGIRSVGFREMIPFVDRIYYYDSVSESFTFIKMRS